MAIALAPDEPRRVTILGATGSIGQSTLSLIGHAPDRYQVEALTAHRDVDRLAEAARFHRARLAVIADEEAYLDLKRALQGSGIEVAAGPEGLAQAAGRPADWIMSAIVGAAGLEPTLAAVRQGAMVALATKESLVCAGSLLIDEVQRSGAVLLPVDSEHNAIFQALRGEDQASVERLILTASGGPFRRHSRAAMASMTPAQAVAHPNWSMGAKISVDSATMMNKGLELIEAHYLFGLDGEQIEILVHPESIIHSMVAFADGSVLAQLGQPDMRIPIAYTLGWPHRINAPTPRLDFSEIAQLTFEAPDEIRFPALRLARTALAAGGIMPTILNAANEIAVAAFLAGRIGFLDIAGVVGDVLERSGNAPVEGLKHIRAIDSDCRRRTAATIERRPMHRISGAAVGA